MPSAPTPSTGPAQAFKDLFLRHAGISLDDLIAAHPRARAVSLRIERIAGDLSPDVFQNITQEIMAMSGLKPDNKPHNEYRLALLQYAADNPRWHIGDQGRIIAANQEHLFEMDVIPHQDGYAFAASRDNNPLELVHALDIGDAAKGVHSIHLQQRLEIRPHASAPRLSVTVEPGVEMETPEFAEDFEPPAP